MDDAAEAGVCVDLFEIRRLWELRWKLWKARRTKRRLQKMEQEFLPRCLEAIVVRGWLGSELDPRDEERLNKDGATLLLSLLESLFVGYSLHIVGIALRPVSDEDETGVTSVMVTFC